MPAYFQSQTKQGFVLKNQESASPTFPTSPNLLLSPVTPVKGLECFLHGFLHDSCLHAHMHAHTSTRMHMQLLTWFPMAFTSSLYAFMSSLPLECEPDLVTSFS